MPTSDFDQDGLDLLPEAQVAAAFLQRLAFVDATADNPERISELLFLLQDAISSVSPDSPAYRMERIQLAVQLAEMSLRLFTPTPTFQPKVPDLEQLRQSAADVAFEAYDFRDYVVVETSGWEHATGSDLWSRAVFLGSHEGGASRKGNFTVEFAPEQDTALDASASIDGVLMAIGLRTTWLLLSTVWPRQSSLNSEAGTSV